MVYGQIGPQSYERIYVNACNVTTHYRRNQDQTYHIQKWHSGRILDGDWDLNVTPINYSLKIAACIDRFKHEKSWEETDIYSHMVTMIRKKGSFDGCLTAADIANRYERIDRLWESIRADGMKSFAVNHLSRPRERGGVLIHIGRNGQPIFGGSGCHRLAIAKILELEHFPAQLGVIHKDAFNAGVLQAYRTPPTASRHQV
jgi:hypothetical protein